MREHEVNKLDNFIGAWYTDEFDLCDRLIDYHSTHEQHVGQMGRDTYDPKKKDSIDCPMEDYSSPVLKDYASLLQKVANNYIQKYPKCNAYAPWGVTQLINIQHYKPTGGYHAWHTERTMKQEPSASRHLVFMTYLNDVTDCGETMWWHQKLVVRPEKGLTVIWPADWTFTHKGIPSPTQDKYIATGWFNFLD
jgi:hypothetical protein